MAEQSEAVRVGHGDVADHDVRFGAFEQGDRLAHRARVVDGRTAAAEDRPHEHPGIFLVVDDEHADAVERRVLGHRARVDAGRRAKAVSAFRVQRGEVTGGLSVVFFDGVVFRS